MTPTAVTDRVLAAATTSAACRSAIVMSAAFTGCAESGGDHVLVVECQRCRWDEPEPVQVVVEAFLDERAVEVRYLGSDRQPSDRATAPGFRPGSGWR